MARREAERGVESVARALDILEGLIVGPRRLSDLARETGLRPSTTHRLLATLVASGHVQRVATGEYALGLRTMRLAANGQRDLDKFQDVVAPYLGRVHRVSRKTTNLFAIDDASTMLIGRLDNADTPMLNVRIGSRLPSHATASGKVSLAFRDPAVVRRAVRMMQLQPFTPNTITDPVQLLDELDRVREQGFAWSNREYSTRTVGIGAPVFDDTEQLVGALSISLVVLHEQRLEEAVAELGELVGCAAMEASITLGYQGPRRWGSQGYDVPSARVA